MAKSKQDKQLYRRLRGSGVRKKVARRLTALSSHAKGGKQAPKPLRDAVARLEASVSELRDHVGRRDGAAMLVQEGQVRAERRQHGTGKPHNGRRRKIRHLSPSSNASSQVPATRTSTAVDDEQDVGVGRSRVERCPEVQ